MKRFFATIACVLLLPSFASAHVGSPNVFYEGQAGPYSLMVVIRPPAALPGVAQVDVRVAGVTNVSLQAMFWDAGKEAAPAAAPAAAVAGETDLFNASLWLFREGSHSVHIMLDGVKGHGKVVVPLNAAATKIPVMPVSLAVTLLVFGLVLFAGAVWLVTGAVHTHVGKPARTRLISLITAIILASTVYAGAVRWQKMDRAFRSNALAKPEPVMASVRTNGTLRLLRLSAVPGNPSQLWDTLVADHGKLMHLFLLREPDYNAFAHLHPIRRDNRTFENVLPPLPAGSYQLYGEITRENGSTETLTANLVLSGSAGVAPQMAFGSNMLNEVFCQSASATISSNAPFALDADDSWHLGRSLASPAQAAPLMGGYKLVFENSSGLVVDREASLRFALFDNEGRPAPLQPYMGMLGHAVVRRADGGVFTHLHPVGTISMAAQQLFERREQSTYALFAESAATNFSAVAQIRGSNPNLAGNELSFPYAFPRAGDYRLWVQVRTGARVLTGVFDVQVKSR